MSSDQLKPVEEHTNTESLESAGDDLDHTFDDVSLNESIEETVKRAKRKPSVTSSTASLTSPAKTYKKAVAFIKEEKEALTKQHVGLFCDLDDAYHDVADDYECETLAKRKWARRAAFCSFFGTMTFLVCGGLFFNSQTDWDPVDVALFTVYTVTSAGYGHVEIPQTAIFQVFDTFYILIGLSFMAIMMAQLYQFLELEAMRVEHARDRVEVIHEGLKKIRKEPPSEKRDEAIATLEKRKEEFLGVFGRILLYLTRLFIFSVENPVGDFVQRIASLCCLAGLGAVVVGTIEGWPWYSAIYWSVVSLTTVGYGDLVPETVAGKVFTTLWLPLNLFFLSILFCSVGHYYLMMSDGQIKKFQRQFKEQKAEEMLNLATNKDTSRRSSREVVQCKDLELGMAEDESEGGDENKVVKGKDQPRRSSLQHEFPPAPLFFGENLDTMKDVIDVVHETSESVRRQDVEIGTISEATGILPKADEPNLELRVLVKERLAYIVAEEVAGKRSSLKIEDEDGKLTVTLGGTKDAADKWLIPRSSRRAFRAVAFEAMLFVGEANLVDRGVEVLFELQPMEFHRIFSPLLASMGGKGALRDWLVSTDVLWDTAAAHNSRMSARSMHIGNRQFVDNGATIEFPTNHAEAFHLFHGI